jgi:glutaminyl-tRNA synthetase
MAIEVARMDNAAAPGNFIEEIIEEDLRTNEHGGRVATRFPPEPNGYLHIGHAKSICLNFGLAAKYGGTCNLRFDDTNPTTEEVEYVESIKEDVRWLGFDWEDREYYASDYFDQLYAWAVELIQAGKAYVDSLSPEEIRKYRGSYYRAGQESPYRNRPVEENLALFERMRAGEFPEGSHVLRAKIDVNSPNMNLRDPPLYRIRHEAHHRTGTKWCIYPMYDFAHGQCDAIERITHSICTLEFEDHRPLYDWFIENLSVPARPEQIEFARLNLTYTVLSKRKLLQLVDKGLVSGWDDPRMPTLSGLRRRGYTPEAIRAFCNRIGVARRDGVVDVALLEHALREDLNARCPRVMAVLRPLRLVLENYPEGQVEEIDAPYFPEEPEKGTRKVPFSRVLYVEREDFREEAPKKWHRLAPGAEVRLRYACLATCREVVKDPATGEVVELRCTWDPKSRGGDAPDGRKVRGTLHWVSAAHALEAEVRLYDRLFLKPHPDEEGGFLEHLNPDSLQVMKACQIEPSLASAAPGDRIQFERLGYFCVDTRDSRPGAPVFNRTITLRDSWAKIEQKEQGGGAG